MDSWLVQGGLMVGLRLVWSGSGLVRVGVGLVFEFRVGVRLEWV